MKIGLKTGCDWTIELNQRNEREDIMLTVKQSYLIAIQKTTSTHLVVIRNFKTAFGFLFEEDRKSVTIGSGYILIDKETKKVFILPTTPNNLNHIQSAKKIPLTAIK